MPARAPARRDAAAWRRSTCARPERPAAALLATAHRAMRHLHPHQRARLVAHVVVRALEVPRHVDVLGRHLGAVEPDVDQRRLAERADHARHGEDATPDALRAAQQAHDRGELDHLELRQEGLAIGDARVAGDAGDARRLEVRHHPAQDLRIGAGVGVHDRARSRRAGRAARRSTPSPCPRSSPWRPGAPCPRSTNGRTASRVPIGRGVVHHHDLVVRIVDGRGRTPASRR